TPPGAALLALRTGAPVVTAFINRRDGGGHAISVAPVDTGGADRPDAGALTARLTAAIEAQIPRAPAGGGWGHERWRGPPAFSRQTRLARIRRVRVSQS